MGGWKIATVKSNGPRAQLKIATARLEQKLKKAPIFVTAQIYSSWAIQEKLDNNMFADPDKVATSMTGLISNVGYGLDGYGTLSQFLTAPFHKHMPHEATIVTGPFIHIPVDIGGGLDKCVKQYGVLPNSKDYLEMYGPVRASMRELSRFLSSRVGPNTWSTSVNALETIISWTGKDPIMGLRDFQFTKRGGILAPGLPSDKNIQFAIQCIKNNPKSKKWIFDN